MTVRCGCLVVSLLLVGTRLSAAAPADFVRPALATKTPPPIERPGPKPREYFWADELVFHEWRIQRNPVLAVCRLLDGAGETHATGRFEQCQTKLEELKHGRSLSAMKGKAVLILHGLGSNRSSCEPLAHYLQDRGGYAAFCLTYPSLFEDVAGSAQSLASVVRNLHGIEELNFVAHSLGNLVIRHYLGDQTDKASGRRPDPRIQRIVMIAPPNHGSAIARSADVEWHDNRYLGKTVEQLGHEWPKLVPKLAVPECEFGIIAGGRGTRFGYNPLLGEDNDAVVEVTSARLAGARDFVLVPHLHFRMHQAPPVHEYVLRFLQHGYFVAADQRQPIPQTPEREPPRPPTIRAY